MNLPDQAQQALDWHDHADEKEGATEMSQLRVWWITNPPSEPEYLLVQSVEEAAEKLDQLAQRDLRDPNVVSNVGGLEIFEEGDWHEYYDDQGRDIRAIMERDEGG